MTWGLFLIAIGVWMSLSGATKTTTPPFRYVVALVSVASGDNAYLLLTVTGTLVGFCGLVIALVY